MFKIGTMLRNTAPEVEEGCMWTQGAVLLVTGTKGRIYFPILFTQVHPYACLAF